LSWIKSFLCDRTQQVSFSGSRSTTGRLSSGFPQGSVLGPLLFILYTAELFELIRISGLMAHSYADDTQIYLCIASKRAQEAVDGLSEFVSFVDVWMNNNCLKLNTDKTQVIWLGTRPQLLKVNTSDIHLQSKSVPCLSVVNNLRVLIDCNLSMSDNISNVCRLCCYQLRQIREVRRWMSPPATSTLIHAFIASRLGYCNSLFYGIGEGLVQ